MDWKEFFNYHLIDLENFRLTVAQLLLALLLLGIARILIGVIRRILLKKLAEHPGDHGKTHAIIQLVRYAFWIIVAVLVFEVLDLKVTWFLAGGAALFVGLGLGLQDMFRDVVSGIILLFERSVAMDDIMEVDGIVGRVTRIGLRTSSMRTRDGKSIIVPNSKFTADNIINWSNDAITTRFSVTVGVAYGTDELMVRDILIDVASKTKGVIQDEEGFTPFVRLIDFGNSSLDFELLFWTHDIFPVENIRSDIRFAILEAFRQNDVTIPFPQRDLHIKTAEVAIPFRSEK